MTAAVHIMTDGDQDWWSIWAFFGMLPDPDVILRPMIGPSILTSRCKFTRAYKKMRGWGVMNATKAPMERPNYCTTVVQKKYHEIRRIRRRRDNWIGP